MRLSLMTATIATAAACLAGAVAANEPPIEDITGAWVGRGSVQQNETANPMRVNCAVEGLQDGERMSFEGECRAMLVVRRAIGLDIVRDGDSFTGTYIGSIAGGAAVLEGTQTEAGTLDLTMTFEREVNGDQLGRMLITQPGDGTFIIMTEDDMASGETVKTAEITFARD